MAVVALSLSNSSGTKTLYSGWFKPLPKNVLVVGEISFTRLSDSQLSQVQVTPLQASRIAMAEYGRHQRWRVVIESLGGYVNKNDIVHDWIGTTSFIPKPVPAYLIRITGAPIVTLGLDRAPNHYWNIIVNAITGKVVSSFTYD
jgi:hypothetical protein